jgi:hypothetical protein
MFNGCDGLPICCLILMDLPMKYKLFASLRMLAFTQSRKLFCAYCTPQGKPSGHSAVPLSLNRVALLPVVLLDSRKFPFVVGLRLRCRERF